MKNMTAVTLAIKKDDFVSETDFRTSNAFQFIMLNSTPSERKNLFECEAYNFAVKILDTINVSTIVKNDESYIVTESINLLKYKSREAQIAGQSVLLYLNEKTSKTNSTLLKLMYKSSIKSLTGKNSEEKISEEAMKEVLDKIDLLTDDSNCKIIQ